MTYGFGGHKHTPTLPVRVLDRGVVVLMLFRSKHGSICVFLCDYVGYVGTHPVFFSSLKQ